MKQIPLVLLACFALLSACKDKETKTSNDEINDWIYANMDFWYFWTDDMRDKPATNVNPGEFFESLLVAQDRFSFYYEDYEELLNLLRGVSLESGFEYQLYRESAGSSNVIMQLVYIKAGSPADLLGLKRGDVFYQINNTTLTTSNYRGLLGQTNSAYTATYRRYNRESESFADMGSVSINPITFSENPILLDTVYELEGKKIGYLIYTFFSPGPSNNSTIYDDQLKSVFGEFKNKGITDMILDLRFNSGGSETSARNLSSLLVKNATTSSLMFKKQYNSQVEKEILDDASLGRNFLEIKFQDFVENIGPNLSSGTLHVITSDRSASASEVVINSLKPYMDVFIVGDTTVGKDAGSISIYDEDDPDNRWALQPIVVKLVNSAGQDYPDGFLPNVLIEDRFLVLEPLGDVNEPLLGAALAAIGVQPARFSSPKSLDRPALYQSLDEKAWYGMMVME